MNPKSEEFKAIIKNVRDRFNTAKREATDHGMIPPGGCNYICNKLDKIIAETVKYRQNGDYSLAYEVCSVVLQKCGWLAGNADSSSGWLNETIDRCKAAIAEISRETPKNSDDAEYIFTNGMKDVFSKEFDGWEDYAYDLLDALAPLTTEKRKPKIIETLDKLNSDERSKRVHKDTTLGIQAEIAIATESKTDAWKFMQKNIAVDEVLEKAIRFKIADEDYETAEKLCLDRINTGKRDAYYPRKWEYLLNDIYNASGDVDKQIKGAEMLFFAGKYDLYKTVKKLHIQKGDWEEVKDGIIAAAERNLPETEYVKILNVEGEKQRILEMAKQNPFHIIKYGKKLMKDYPEEVIALFKQAIDAQADFSKTRTHYRYLAKHIKALADCGQTELALQIIDELIEEYPRRTSMIDELDELRYRLQ